MLDTISTPALMAVSSRKLRGAYTGFQSRLRVNPGSTEGDLGFSTDGQDIDTTALAALLGSSDGALVKWYDQAPAAHDLAQVAAAAQPQAKATTVHTINGHQAFKGSKASHLRISTPSFDWGIGTGDFLISMIIKTPSFENWSALWSFGTDNPSFYVSVGASPTWELINPFSNPFTGTVSANTVYVVTLARESGTVKLWINGIQDATTVASVTNAIGNTTFTLFEDAAAGIDGGSSFVQECVIFGSALSSDRAALMANQKAYAGL